MVSIHEIREPSSNYGNFSIDNEKFSINLKFYFFLKHLVKTKLTNKQIQTTLERYYRYEKNGYEKVLSALWHQIDHIKGVRKQQSYSLVIEQIKSDSDLLLFIFSLRLMLVKDLLMAEAKIKSDFIARELADLHPLSLKYDQLSVYDPYATRVNGALLVALFFQRLESGEAVFLSTDTADLMNHLAETSVQLRQMGVESNQIFMLMFSESVNQSIISDSGTNYEQRLFTVLVDTLGIPPESIKHVHDSADVSTEYDFFFDLEGKTYGIGAKKTLRERYKQFIKTSESIDVDVMIEITIGMDLNLQKAKTIRNYGVFLFVSPEIYEASEDLQALEGIYSVESLSLGLLRELGETAR